MGEQERPQEANAERSQTKNILSFSYREKCFLVVDV